MNIDKQLKQKAKMINWLKNPENFSNAQYNARMQVYRKFQKSLRMSVYMEELEELQKEAVSEFFPDAVTVERWYAMQMISKEMYNWYMDILEPEQRKEDVAL